jgi:hypothetical protein
MEAILHNMTYVYIAMAVVVFLLTNVLKLPIKALTHHIKNEKIRKRVNTVIYLIPFALGIAFDFVYSMYFLEGAYSIIRGLGYGTASITLYHGFEQNFKIKVDNPYESDEGQAVLGLVETITEDGKIDKQDVDAVKEFWDAVK